MSGYERVNSAQSADTTGPRSVTANCPGSKVVVGGGFDTFRSGDLADIVVTRSSPEGNGAWTVVATSLGSSFAIRAYAMCARAN